MQPLSTVITEIVERHHAFVRRETPRIGSLLAELGGTYPEIRPIEQLFTTLGDELNSHMFKEERVLFPYITSLEQAVREGKTRPRSCFGSVAQPIAQMRSEHDDADGLIARIQSLASRYAGSDALPLRSLCQALEEFGSDLHRHIDLENNVLFPQAAALEQGHLVAH